MIGSISIVTMNAGASYKYVFSIKYLATGCIQQSQMASERCESLQVDKLLTNVSFSQAWQCSPTCTWQHKHGSAHFLLQSR